MPDGDAKEMQDAFVITNRPDDGSEMMHYCMPFTQTGPIRRGAICGIACTHDELL